MKEDQEQRAEEQKKDDALTPSQPQFLTRRSASLVQRGLSEALSLQTTEAYYKRARRKERVDPDGAIKDYSRAIEIDPRFAKAYVARALMKKDRRDYSAAIDDLTKAIQINPRDAKKYNQRGILKQCQGNHQGAVEDYTIAIGLNPLYGPPYYNRYLAKRSTGDYDSAIEDYDRAIEINPRLARRHKSRLR